MTYADELRELTPSQKFDEMMWNKRGRSEVKPVSSATQEPDEPESSSENISLQPSY